MPQEPYVGIAVTKPIQHEWHTPQRPGHSSVNKNVFLPVHCGRHSTWPTMQSHSILLSSGRVTIAINRKVGLEGTMPSCFDMMFQMRLIQDLRQAHSSSTLVCLSMCFMYVQTAATTLSRFNQLLPHLLNLGGMHLCHIAGLSNRASQHACSPHACMYVSGLRAFRPRPGQVLNIIILQRLCQSMLRP
jgi:hypothetical protein